MPKADDSAIGYLSSRPVLLRSLTVALVVGLVLSAVNQGDVITTGELSAIVWIKIFFNFLVPFSVASVSALLNRTRH